MKHLLWGVLFFVLAYLVPAGGRPMIRPDEFRYAEIPHEMLESGDFVTPKLLQVKYFEKPVLGYWLIAASFRLLGENRFSLRLPMALATGMTALLILLWIRRETRDAKAGGFAALLFLSSGLTFALGTTAVLDAILCLFTTATIIAARMAVTTERRPFERVIWLVLCGICAGLGFLTKGFVAWAVPGSAILVWLLWEKRFKALLWLPYLPLVALAATVFPWAWAIHRADADFWHYFVVVEHFQRFRNVAESQHPEPFWYFVPILLATVFPAAFAAFSGFAAGREVWKRIWRDPVWRFALCGFLPPFLFFSASNGKLATYILPCYPFLAVLAALPTLAALRGEVRGALLTQRLTFDILGWGVLAGGAGSAALGLALLPPVSLYRFVPELEGAWGFFLLFGAVGAVGGIALLRLRAARPERRLAGFFALFALAGAASAALPDFGVDKMPERYLRRLAADEGFDSKRVLIFTNGQMGHAVAWIFRRPDTLLMNSAGEMDYGVAAAKREGKLKLLTLREVEKLLRRPDRPEVVYFASYDPEDLEDPKKNHRYGGLLGHDPRIRIAGPIILLVFPKPVPEP